MQQYTYLLSRLDAIQEGDGTLLDHCMIAYGSGIHDGNLHNSEDLPTLLAGRGNLHYAAFDALWVKGKDLRGLPLTRRKRALGRVIWASSTVLSQVFSIEERGRDLLAAA